MTSLFYGLIKLLRPKQWVKSAFVVLPCIFSGAFFQMSSLMSTILAVVWFSLAASAVYIVNDLHDIEHDKAHATKSKKRPLASGQVQPYQALILLGVLYGILVFGYFQQPQVLQVIAGYIVLNLAYTWVLKHQPVIDIFTIAIGFVLRVYAGAVALTVPVSSWMFVTVLCLALYLASVKRRQELIYQGKGSRKVLSQYSVSLVDRYAEMSATGALIFYSLFVMTVHPRLVFTIPLVLYGLFRYWFIVETKEGGESPTDALLSDWQLIVVIVLWLGCCGWGLFR
jgi:decaprenyl-phosphate phosphoribosyltransferase